MHPLYFLGRFHVLILHLPIALVLIVAGLEWFARGPRRAEMEPALRLLWAATAITAILTVVLGYLHFSEGGFTGPSAMAHRMLGTSVAVVATVAWILRSRVPRVFPKARAPVTILLVALVTLTGHFGGNLTHGDTYLVEYAPNAIRRLAGLEVARPAVTDIAAADPYLDVVRPIFSARCFSCHNGDKRRGGLNLSTYASLVKGGKDGPVVVEGSPKDSDLFRRISLSPDQKDIMPAEGKTPLTAEQIAIVGWWIQGGMKTGTTLGALKAPGEIRTLIATQLGVGASGAGVSAGSESLRSADPKLIAALTQNGFMARQVSRGDPHLLVSPLAPGSKFTTAQINTLVASAADQIVELDLQRAGLDDAAVAPLTQLRQLTRLRLDHNLLTDKSVAALSKLEKLELLSVYDNKGVGDASVDALVHMRSLHKVYLWETGVSERGVTQLKQLKPDIQASLGDSEPATTASVSVPTHKS